MIKYFKDPTLSSWGFMASKISVLLVLTTLIVKNFSIGEIALWYLFTSIQGFAHLFDVGFSATILRFTAYSRAKKAESIPKNFQRLYGSMNTVFTALTLVVVIFLLLIGEYSVKPLVIDNNIANGLLSYKMILLIMPINFFLKKNDAFIKGLNKVSYFNNWNAVMYLIVGISTILAILLKQPFHIVILVNQIALLLNSIKNIFLLKSILLFKANFFYFSFNRRILIEYWTPTWKSALISFSSNGATNLVNIMMPKFFSLEITASYLFTMRLIQVISEFSWAPFYSHLPEFIQNFKKNRIFETAKKAYHRLEISLVLFIGGVFLLALSGNFVLEFINSNTKLLPLNLLGMLLLMLTFERFTAMHSQVIMFSNNIEHYKQYVVMAISYILLFLVTKGVLWLYSIPFAYIVSVLFPATIILRRSTTLMKIELSSYLRKNCLKALILLIISLIIIILWE